jgi:uncharacterized protein (DUF433 family)
MSSLRINLPDTVPLVQWEDGTIRVHDSRVTLDTIVARFQVGDTLAEIHDGFPTVSPEQIKTIIDWYLNNQAEADSYLEQEEAEAERLRLEIQSRPEYKAQTEFLRRKREGFLRRRDEQLIKT